MATLQARIDDASKSRADELFSSLGMDTPTAVRVFISAALENDGFPFAIRHRGQSASLREAIEDTRLKRNLSGPYDSAEAAIASMLEG